MNYDHTAGKAYCDSIGMMWDEAFAERVDEVAFLHNITQDQFDIMVQEYAWRVKVMWNPPQYSYLQRIAIALHFLNPFAKKV